jgi:hypothetical protein
VKQSASISASDRLLAALPAISAAMLTGTPLASLELLRELGSLLYAISRGEPADRLFRQHKRSKPKADRTGVALVYYYVWACTDDAAVAIDRAARAHSFGKRTGSEKPLSKASVRKLAQKYRRAALCLLEQRPNEAATRARIYLCNPRQLYVLLNKGGDVTQGRLSAQEAAELQELARYKLTAEKVARLREYLRKKSPRPDMDK